MKNERYDDLPRRWEDINMVRESELRVLPMSSIHNHQATGWRNRRIFEERILSRDYPSMVRIGNWKSPALIDGLIQVLLYIKFLNISIA